MNAVIICPDIRESAGFARRIKPLALFPVLGRALIDLWLERLASDGVKFVTVLAADRPDEIRRAIGKGDRWGLLVTVLPVASEPSLDQARLFGADAQARVLKLDSLPSLPQIPLWESAEELFGVMMKEFRHTEIAPHLTMRRIAPDVFISTRARVSPKATIEGPAWIGPQVIIGPGAHIMPGTIIESSAYIDRQATVRGSWIGPKTYVGAMTEISHSFAWGGGLENWRLGSFIEVTDDFLLASLKQQPFGGARSGWLTRMFALLLMLITSPIALTCMAWSRLVCQRAAFNRVQVTLPPPGAQDRYTRTLGLHSLNGLGGLFARWPQLWRVWLGDMHLVGNRPLTPAAASLLGDEFEQLWLASPAGVFSLADATNDGLSDPESGLAHAAYYSVHRGFRLNISILLRCLPRFLSVRHLTEDHGVSPSPNLTTAHA